MKKQKTFNVGDTVITPISLRPATIVSISQGTVTSQANDESLKGGCGVGCATLYKCGVYMPNITEVDSSYVTGRWMGKELKEWKL